MKMGLTIYLARHGQDEDNAAGLLNGRRDQPLTALGQTQARHLADQIVGAMLDDTEGCASSSTIRPFVAIYASPLRRANRTAEIIAETINRQGIGTHLSVTKLDDLQERDFGVMTGTPINEIEQRCPDPDDVFQTDTVMYFLKPDGAETFPQLQERAARVIQYLEERHKEEEDSEADPSRCILLVTHGDFGKMFYAHYYDLDWKEVLDHFHFGNSELIVCSPDIKMDCLSKNRTPSQNQTHVFQQQQHNA